MKLVLSNYHYRPKNAGGGNLHIEAFVRQALDEGHQLYSSAYCQHPRIHTLPDHVVGQWWHLHNADIHYVRLQEAYPRKMFSRWFTPPWRQWIPRPKLVWEFNTIPEQGACIGQAASEIRANKDAFARAAGHCDLAVCVSEAISDYVRREWGIRSTLVIPNGGYTRPAPVPRTDGFHVVWAGSGNIDWNDFELLIAAARLLPSLPGGEKIRVHLYGPGIDAWGQLPENIQTHGPKSHHELVDAFASMHAGLCLYKKGPADYSSPLKFFDCLASGLPVITTPHPQMDAVQKQMGASGLVITDRSPETFARVLVALAADLRHTGQLSARARQLVADHYAWPDLMARLFQQLRQLADVPHA